MFDHQIAAGPLSTASCLPELSCCMAKVGIIITEKFHIFRAVPCRLEEDTDSAPGFGNRMTKDQAFFKPGPETDKFLAQEIVVKAIITAA